MTAALLTSAVIPAYAQTPDASANIAAVGTSSPKALSPERIAKIKDHAGKEIDRRIAALGELSSRIGEMKHITEGSKATLTTNIQTQVTALNDLKTKITADTDTATLRADVESVTKSYRIFMLIIPQGHLTASSDRVIDISALMSAVLSKLQARVAEISASGKDVTAMNASLTDLAAKIAEAKTQAEAAIGVIAALQPDEGDKVKMAANTAALKDSRSKIKTAEVSLKAARADIKSVLSALKAIKPEHKETKATSTQATASTTAAQ